MKPIAKDWWRDFFVPIVGEIMFTPKAKDSAADVEEVLKRTHVKPPHEILDLACGMGRHSILFAKRGFKVTGLDYSEPFLREARKTTRAAGQKVRFVRGDMRKLGRHFAANEFSLVVSLYNSFGYFGSRRDDVKMLNSVYRVLKPGGMFVVNTLNRDGVTKRLATPISMGREPLPNVFVIDTARYDTSKRETLATWTIIDTRSAKARVTRKSFRQNVYSHSELKQMLRAAGFEIDSAWGTLQGGSPFNPRKSWHQTIAARKPA